MGSRGGGCLVRSPHGAKRNVGLRAERSPRISLRSSGLRLRRSLTLSIRLRLFMAKASRLKEIRRIAYCPHCGNRAPQKLIHTQKHLERVWSGDGEEADPVLWSMFVAVCETCHQLLLYENFGDQDDPEQFHHCELAFPKPSRLSISVPRQIAVIYEEAIRIKELAPNAFAVQIRRALEALSADKGIKRGTLQDQLNVLVKNGDIPPTLAKASEFLRMVGNVGAHASEQSVHPLLANAIDEFFRAVVEYVYVAPKRLEEFERQMDKYLHKK